MSIRFILILIFSAGYVRIYAQDMHFTQFYATPVFTNPALTGHFDGTYRYNGITRQQWLSISAQPYQSFSGTIEMTQPLRIKPMGIGLQVNLDQTGASVYTTKEIYIPLSCTFHFGTNKDYSLSYGLKPGFFQKSIDLSRLTFGDQFNGIKFDPNAATSENLYSPSITKFNLDYGIYLDKRISNRQYYGLGFSSNNVTQPNLAFFLGADNKLPKRNSFVFLSSFPITTKLDLLPVANYMTQSEHQELAFGTSIKWHFEDEDREEQSVQVGILGRWGDAVNLTAGYIKGNFFIGGAYDFNLSKLKIASNFLGGWEFGIIYTIATVRDKVKRTRLCPDYL